VKLAIEGYKATDKKGFRIAYLLEADYKNKIPTSAKNAPIKFSILESPKLQ